MMRNGQTTALINDESLAYMSDMAIELAQMAEDSGLATLAYLFRMAALEASTQKPRKGLNLRYPGAGQGRLRQANQTLFSGGLGRQKRGRLR